MHKTQAMPLYPTLNYLVPCLLPTSVYLVNQCTLFNYNKAIIGSTYVRERRVKLYKTALQTLGRVLRGLLIKDTVEIPVQMVVMHNNAVVAAEFSECTDYVAHKQERAHGEQHDSYPAEFHWNMCHVLLSQL